MPCRSCRYRSANGNTSGAHDFVSQRCAIAARAFCGTPVPTAQHLRRVCDDDGLTPMVRLCDTACTRAGCGRRARAAGRALSASSGASSCSCTTFRIVAQPTSCTRHDSEERDCGPAHGFVSQSLYLILCSGSRVRAGVFATVLVPPGRSKIEDQMYMLYAEHERARANGLIPLVRGAVVLTEPKTRRKYVHSLRMEVNERLTKMELAVNEVRASSPPNTPQAPWLKLTLTLAHPQGGDGDSSFEGHHKAAVHNIAFREKYVLAADTDDEKRAWIRRVPSLLPGRHAPPWPGKMPMRAAAVVARCGLTVPTVAVPLQMHPVCRGVKDATAVLFALPARCGRPQPRQPRQPGQPVRPCRQSCGQSCAGKGSVEEQNGLQEHRGSPCGKRPWLPPQARTAVVCLVAVPKHRGMCDTRRACLCCALQLTRWRIKSTVTFRSRRWRATGAGNLELRTGRGLKERVPSLAGVCSSSQLGHRNDTVANECRTRSGRCPNRPPRGRASPGGQHPDAAAGGDARVRVARNCLPASYLPVYLT